MEREPAYRAPAPPIVPWRAQYPAYHEPGLYLVRLVEEGGSLVAEVLHPHHMPRSTGRRRDIPEDVRQRISRERAAGRTLEAIVEGLEADKIPTARNGRWRMSTVRGVLRQIADDDKSTP